MVTKREIQSDQLKMLIMDLTVMEFQISAGEDELVAQVDQVNQCVELYQIRQAYLSGMDRRDIAHEYRTTVASVDNAVEMLD